MFYNSEKKMITTNRLLLRIFQQSDAEEVTRLCNNYNIYKNTLFIPYPYTLDDAVKWIDSHLEKFNNERVYEFAITDKITGTLYGAIALTNIRSFRHGELGYWIGEDYWGNGYATEAAEAMLKFGFFEKDYHRIFARHFLSNPASGKVLPKIGMKKEGIFREHVIKDEEYKDLAFYGILKSEYKLNG